MTDYLAVQGIAFIVAIALCVVGLVLAWLSDRRQG